jgi:hypothetical protein
MIPNGKTTAAAPKLSDDDHVELAEIPPSGPPPEEDIMQLARVGDIAGIERLYALGKFDAQYCDEEGITPLHVFVPVLPIWTSLLTLPVVGRYQQPICDVRLSPESRGRCEQKGRRVGCYSYNVGCAEMPLLYR